MGKIALKNKYKENPFLDSFTVTTRGKRISVSALGKTEDNILINQNTGEVLGTHVTSFKQVDDAEFIKVFTANIALTFDLSQPGRKVFDMLLHVMQKQAISKDQIYLDDGVRQDFVMEHGVKMATSTMYRGIDNLVERCIIARSTRTNIYFINPSLVFNGDRVAFTRVIERKKSVRDREEEQQELPINDDF